MLGRFSNFLNQAVEALAPVQNNLDDFEFHWRATTGYFLENRDAKAPFHTTAIPSHLDSMLDNLCEEESRFFEAHPLEGSVYGQADSLRPAGAATGPCMEFLLQNKILETLLLLVELIVHLACSTKFWTFSQNC